MAKGTSESTTTSQSSTTNADQRVAATEQAVAIGAGAQYNPSTSTTSETNIAYNFPKEVADFANKLLDFAGGILSGVNETLQKNLAVNESLVNNALNTSVTGASQAVAEANKTALAAVSPSTAATSTITGNLIPLAVIGGVIMIVLNLFKKRG